MLSYIYEFSYDPIDAKEGDTYFNTKSKTVRLYTKGDWINAYKNVLAEIKEERIKQDSRWGVQNHSPEHWLMILGEEVGEVNRAALEGIVLDSNGIKVHDKWKNYREELIQVAAVAIAMVESYDRKINK